jgi:hypothetical protein
MLNNIRFANLGGGVALSVHPSPNPHLKKPPVKYSKKSQKMDILEEPPVVYLSGDIV